MVDKSFLRKLREIVGPEGLFEGWEERVTYENDALQHYHAVPAAVILPSSTEQVQGVVALCRDEEVPIVPRGSGTGLSAGALPTEQGVVIALTRMNRILEVDLENQRAVVQAGVFNQAITRQVAPSGYYFAPDPSSQQVCTVGGNVAENAGGAHCLKYGFTANHVLGLTAVLSDGRVIKLGGKGVDRPGYDLVGVIVGSEGTLALVTEATVRLVRKAESVMTLQAAFASTDDAGKAVSDIIAARMLPAAIEMMDRLSIQAAEAAVRAGYPLDAGAILLVELDGPRAEVEELVEAVEDICRRDGASSIRVAQTDDERAVMWKGRKSAFAAMGRISRDYLVQDGVIPRTQLPRVLHEIGEMAESYGLRVANVFHAGDGNLHPLVLYDGHVEGEVDRARELSSRILAACVTAGGSITGEHGVGLDKRRYLELMFSQDDMAGMQLLRCAVDPIRLFNPGKIFPTPRLCGEKGKI